DRRGVGRPRHRLHARPPHVGPGLPRDMGPVRPLPRRREHGRGRRLPVLPRPAHRGVLAVAERAAALSRPLPGGPDGCVSTGPGPLVVALCTEERGGHEWPPYATDLIIDFFTARPSLPKA